MSAYELIYDKARAVLLKQGQLVEYIINPVGDALGIGAICLARITQSFPKQKRANCQLANGQMASFRIADGVPCHSGDLIWITLSAMPRQQKPWQAEQGVNRAGRLIILHHGKEGVRLSHKAKGQIDDSLLAEVKAALPDGWGAVLKRASIAASADEIRHEITQLLAPLDLPLTLDEGRSAPACLYHGDEAQLALSLIAPDAAMRYEADRLFWQEIEDQAHEASLREVTLANGAVLCFDVTRALVAVDVDSAASQLGPLALAKYTAPEIMRLIRLASYSGVIVIDMPRLAFKDMAPVLAAMRAAAQDDIRHPDVLGISRAGLIELVVRHRLAPLASRLATES